MPGDTATSILCKLFAVAALVSLNGFFVAAELALVKVRDTQLDTLVFKGHRRAKIARQLVRNLDAAISATQLGITLASLGLGVLVEPVFNALLAPIYSWWKVESETVRHTVAILVGFFTNTFLLIVVGELAPKAVAIRKTVSVAIWTAAPGNCLAGHGGDDSRMPRPGGEDPLLAFSLERRRRPRQNARRRSHQGFVRHAHQGAQRRGPAVGVSQVDLCAGDRAPGKTAA